MNGIAAKARRPAGAGIATTEITPVEARKVAVDVLGSNRKRLYAVVP
jgi:hypothetical protein